MKAAKVIASKANKPGKYKVVIITNDGEEIILSKAGKLYNTVWVYVSPEGYEYAGREFYTQGKAPSSHIRAWVVGSLPVEVAA